MNPLDVMYAIGAVALTPWWATKIRSGWRERLGHARPLGQTPLPRLMIHAVSVGEVNAVRELVPLLASRGVEVVLSVGTDTGIARARALFEPQPIASRDSSHASGREPIPAGGDGRSAGRQSAAPIRVVRYPLDFSRCVDRFLDAIRPDAVGLVELEVWPNFIGACARRGVGVGVINGRLSERSFRGYRRIRPFIASSFSSLAFAAVQDDDYAERFRAMGTPPERVRVTGTMKWDAAAITDDVPAAAALARDLGIDPSVPLVVGGSTGPEEEALLHAACLQAAQVVPAGRVQLLCAPRRPERFDEAAGALPNCVRRSHPPARPARADRFLLDTIGELRAAYALADLVVMGRSFGSLYGSDPIEPIALGKPTLIGPSHADFLNVVRTLSSPAIPSGAATGTVAETPAPPTGLIVTPAQGLAGLIGDLLADPARRAAMAAAGRASIRAHQGATQRHADLLETLARACRKEARIAPPTGRA